MTLLKNNQQIYACNTILGELMRVEDAVVDLLVELKENERILEKDMYPKYQSAKRGRVKHRIIDLKYELTRLAKEI